MAAHGAPFRDARLQSQCRKKSASSRNRKEAFAEMRHLIIFIYCREETIDEGKSQLLSLFAVRSGHLYLKYFSLSVLLAGVFFINIYQPMVSLRLFSLMKPSALLISRVLEKNGITKFGVH